LVNKPTQLFANFNLASVINEKRIAASLPFQYHLQQKLFLLKVPKFIAKDDVNKTAKIGFRRVIDTTRKAKFQIFEHTLLY
jgi:hypothetical protein